MSTYTGRLGKICDRIRWDANLSSGNTIATEAQLLDLVNRCQQDLAQSRFYRKETLVDVVAGEDTIDLAETVPDLYELYGLFWVADSANPRRLWEVSNDAEAQRALLCLEDGDPQAFYVRDNDLQLLPAPASSTADALVILYYYVPDDLTGLTASTGPPVVLDGTTPVAVLEADDDIFVRFGLWMLFARDHLSPTALKLANYYESQYETKKRRAAKRHHKSGRVVPYR